MALLNCIRLDTSYIYNTVVRERNDDAQILLCINEWKCSIRQAGRSAEVLARASRVTRPQTFSAKFINNYPEAQLACTLKAAKVMSQSFNATKLAH